MSKFIGTKIVDAVPGLMVNEGYWPEGMNLSDLKKVKDACKQEKCDPEIKIEEGYYYIYEKGYVRWMSKEVFEKQFRPAENMSFGQAIEAAKQGGQIARRGWNGKGQYVELASCVSYIDPYGNKVNADHAAAGNRAFAFVGTSGVQLGWLALQADMLAEDWYIVELAPSENDQ